MTDWSRISENMVQEFILKNEHADERELVLQHKTLFDLPAKLIAEQIAGRRKAKRKLQLWFETKGIVYPPTLNLEQSSSQATARFKATLLKRLTKQNTLVDLTGGFGVDSYFFSINFRSVIYVEPNVDLESIVQQNHARLGALNIKHLHTTAEDFLSNTEQTGVFFIDPARRDAQSRKVFKLADCTPDVTLLQSQLFTKADWLVLKASPLLDIQQGLRELPNTQKVIVVSLENEMKELLFIAWKDFHAAPDISAVDLDSDGTVKSEFLFTQPEETTSQSNFSDPQKYLYEPGAAILKAGAFKLIGQHFNLKKLALHTHLYTSGELIENFPGRTFLIKQLNPTDKQLKELLPESRAHVAVRNYPLTASQLMKKLKLQEGGELFVWGFATNQRKNLAICERIVQ